MLINIKAQLEVKVKKGQADQQYMDITDDLVEEMQILLYNFLRERDQDPTLYAFCVSEGKCSMRF